MDPRLPITECITQEDTNTRVNNIVDDAVGVDFYWDSEQPDCVGRTTVIVITTTTLGIVINVSWLEDQDPPEKLTDLFVTPNVVKVLCGVTANRLKSLRRAGLHLANYIDLAEIDRKTTKSAPKKDLPTLVRENFASDIGQPPHLSEPSHKHWVVKCSYMCLQVFKANPERVPALLRKMALPCEHCDRVFSSTKSLDLHHQAHESNATRPQHRCPQCQKHFRSRPALVQHMDVAHPTHPLPRPDTQDGETHQFYCGECDAQYPSFLALQRHHTQIGHSSQIWVCEWCGKRFGTRSALDMHYHVTHATQNAEHEMHLCSVCARSFTSCDALYQHQLCVGHALAEICLVCSASFKSKQELEDHFACTKHSEFWVCADCPKKFPERDALAKHESSTGHQGGSKVAEVPPDVAQRFRQPRRPRQREEIRDSEAKAWDPLAERHMNTPRSSTGELAMLYPPLVTFASPYYVDQAYHQLYSPAFSTRATDFNYYATGPQGQSSPVAYLSLIPCPLLPHLPPNISPASGCESLGYSEGSPSAITGTPTKGEYSGQQHTTSPPYCFRQYPPSTPPTSPYHLRGQVTPDHGHHSSPIFAQFWAEATAPYDGNPSPGPVWLMTSPSTLFRPSNVPPSPPFDLMAAIGQTTPNKFDGFSCTSHNPYAL